MLVVVNIEHSSLPEVVLAKISAMIEQVLIVVPIESLELVSAEVPHISGLLWLFGHLGNQVV